MTEDTEHKFKAREAALLKWDEKRKGDTPFEPYVYIATKVIAFTIHARRVSDGKTAATNNIHPSKRQAKETTYCKTSSDWSCERAFLWWN